MLNAIESTQPITGVKQEGTSNRLKNTCAEFESIFMTYMLKSMRTSLVEEGMMGNSHASKIINGMYDENLALEVARGGGIGLGKVLFERLREAPDLSFDKEESAQVKGGGPHAEGGG